MHQNDWLLKKHPKELFVLLVAVTVTIAAWLVSTYLVEKNDRERFEIRSTEIADAIFIRMGTYEQVLLGGAGFMEASYVVTRDEWKMYVDSLKLPTLWPGIQGLGYSIPVSKDEKVSHINIMRAQGFPDYTITPLGERESYSAIIFIEPFDWRNKRAFGYDMWSNDMRREAMSRTMKTGQATISGQITLVQETDTDVQAGFLMYTPVYENDAKLDTPEDRINAFKGWVYGAFRMGDLMKGILGVNIDDIDYAVYDSIGTNDHRLLYSTTAEKLDINSDAVFTKSLNLQGRSWTIVFKYNPLATAGIEAMVPNIIVSAGIMVDLLIYYLMLTMISTNQKANLLTEKRTKELAEAKEAAEEANKAKSEFLSSMSHELRSPLNSVIAYSQLALSEAEKTPIPASTKQYITTIMKSGEHLLDLIGNILDLSKIEAGKATLDVVPFSILQVVEEVASMMTISAQDRGNDLRLDFATNVPTACLGDVVKIRQVILNLVANAVKFTENGQVVIRLCLEKSDGVMATIRVEVSDTGIGIAKGMQDKLFDVFTQADMSTTRKYGGTGLGLAISKNLITAMGGTIGLMSEEGKGSTFWFNVTLPITDIASDQPSNPNHQEDLQLNILLVEDIEVNRIVASRLLETSGHTVTSVENGIKAIDAVRNTDFDVVLMDIHMPDMDGITATKTIRAMTDPVKSSTPIIALTADINTANIDTYKAAGMNGHCAKPLKLEQLNNQIRLHGRKISNEARTESHNPKMKETKATPSLQSGFLYEVDESQFELCMENVPGVLEAFSAEAEKLIIRLPVYLAEQDYKGLQGAAHSLKGMCLNLGYSSLVTTCEEICIMCQEKSEWKKLQVKTKALPGMIKAYKDYTARLQFEKQLG